MTIEPTAEEKRRYNAKYQLPREACNCHHGSARFCPVHTQADYDAARLSHERGADADVLAIVDGLIDHAEHLKPMEIVAAGIIVREYLERSVPAPTLPALDADALAKAMTAHAATHKVHSRSHVRASCAISIAEQYEALRDAVYTDKGPAHVDWDARDAIILDETGGGRDAV